MTSPRVSIALAAERSVRLTRKDHMNQLTSEERKRADLVQVLSLVWKAADKREDWVEKHLTADYRAPVEGSPMDIVDQLCGHDLKLAGDRRFMVGGGGVIIPCREAAPELGAAEGEVRYALKVARPSLFSTEAEAGTEFGKARNEYLTQLPLAHENIAKMFNLGELLVPRAGVYLRIPCTLIEWIDDALPLDDYIRERVRDPYEVADLLAQTGRGLAHLHRSGKVHWDIKGDNVLVDGSGRVKIMDLGNARPLLSATKCYGASDEAETTDRNLPPELQQRLRAISGPPSPHPPSENRMPCPLRGGELNWDQPWLDLFMLAREVNRVFGFNTETANLDGLAPSVDGDASKDLKNRVFQGEDGSFVAEYVDRVLNRVLSACSPDHEAIYPTADELVQALDRLKPEYGEATDVPELQAVPQHVLRIPPAENVPWTDRVRALMTSHPLLRLKGHLQLATVAQVFPGAVHTRWEHAAGTFNVALQYVRALYADRSSVFFRLDTSRLDVIALMLATLMHDLGHPSFGHQLEESPAIPPERHHERYAIAVLRACLEGTSAISPSVHRDATILRPILETYWAQDIEGVDSLLTRAIEILGVRDAPAPSAAEPRVERVRRVHTELLHSIVSGQLDADKADYLVRDAHHAGVEYPNGIDTARLHQSLTSVLATRKEQPGLHGMLGVTHKGILPLESLLIARYQMFRAVYWQHTVRAMTVMLQDLVESYLLPQGSGEIDANRVDELLEQFRELPDEKALAWLVARAPDELKGYEAAILGDRTHIYWRVAELRGHGGDDIPQDDAVSTSDRPPRDRETYVNLLKRWSPAPGEERSAAILERRALREGLAQRVSKSLSEAGVAGVRVNGSQLLLDVPVVGRDEVTGLFVALDDEPKRPIVQLERLTPLARGVAEAFRTSVRPARVFLHPEIASQMLVSREAERTVDEIFRDELRGLVVRQLQLDLAPSLRSR
jgi:uncharacterized protein